MSVRSNDTLITFRRPFTLSALDRSQPAGTYRLVVDEVEIPDLPFAAYQRVATMLHTPDIASLNGRREVFVVDPVELASTLEADSRD